MIGTFVRSNSPTKNFLLQIDSNPFLTFNGTGKKTIVERNLEINNSNLKAGGTLMCDDANGTGYFFRNLFRIWNREGTQIPVIRFSLGDGKSQKDGPIDIRPSQMTLKAGMRARH